MPFLGDMLVPCRVLFSEHLQFGGPCSFGYTDSFFGEVGPFQKNVGKLRNKGSEIIFKNSDQVGSYPCQVGTQKDNFSLFFLLGIFFFGCQLLGYLSRAVRPSVSYNNAKRTIPVREKKQKHSRSFTFIGQNNETN